ncbi:MAG: gamma-glutamylcyclotransferase [Planctomycetales bacterium]|nr:gamma-glutamylcyclotransferase [Planctomycetales bacterium]
MKNQGKLCANIFVYGTLKRGQCREKCWPRPPLQVNPAWTFGYLYDLGDYPALIDGTDRIAGEVWSFLDADLDEVLAVLDGIEGTNQPAERNEYDRITDNVFLMSGDSTRAQMYVYARREVLSEGMKLVALTSDMYVAWPTTRATKT